MRTEEELKEIDKALEIVEYYENLFLEPIWHLELNQILEWDSAHEKLASLGMYYEARKSK